jgi:hypothetical protein
MIWLLQKSLLCRGIGLFESVSGGKRKRGSGGMGKVKGIRGGKRKRDAGGMGEVMGSTLVTH